jgi:hypothetical protein
MFLVNPGHNNPRHIQVKIVRSQLTLYFYTVIRKFNICDFLSPEMTVLHVVKSWIFKSLGSDPGFFYQ